jgi:hypothetical protein
MSSDISAPVVLEATNPITELAPYEDFGFTWNSTDVVGTHLQTWSITPLNQYSDTEAPNLNQLNQKYNHFSTCKHIMYFECESQYLADGCIVFVLAKGGSDTLDMRTANLRSAVFWNPILHPQKVLNVNELKITLDQDTSFDPYPQNLTSLYLRAYVYRPFIGNGPATVAYLSVKAQRLIMPMISYGPTIPMYQESGDGFLISGLAYQACTIDTVAE